MFGASGRKNIEIKDFSGGLVTKCPPKNIDSKFSVDCLNVYAEGAMLRKRGGISVVNPTAATGGGYGLYNWVRGSATTNQWLIGFWGSSLLKMDVVGTAWDGSWDTIVADSAAGTSFGTGTLSQMCFANFNSVLLMTNENWDVPQKMTTSDASYKNLITGGSGTCPNAKFVTVWKNHAWFLNCTGSEDKIVHSAVNSYNNFDGSTAGSHTLLTENDIGLTGWFDLAGKLYVTKTWSIHRFTYTGSADPLVQINIVKNSIGTKSPRTIKVIRGVEYGMVMFLASNKKLYMFSGSDVAEASDSIDTSNGISLVSMQSINAAALNNCFAIVHEDKNWYELFVCMGTSTTPNYSIVYDYIQKSFWPMGNRGFTAGCIANDGAGGWRAYAQEATTGSLYLLESGSSDNGVAINGYWTGQKIGVPTELQKIDQVEVETEAVACTPVFSWRADWESAWVSQTMKANQNSHNWGPGRIDNLIQFKIADNSTTATFKLWTIIASNRMIGGGK